MLWCVLQLYLLQDIKQALFINRKIEQHVNRKRIRPFS